MSNFNKPHFDELTLTLKSQTPAFQLVEASEKRSVINLYNTGQKIE